MPGRKRTVTAGHICVSVLLTRRCLVARDCFMPSKQLQSPLLELADSLPGDPKLLADFFQSVIARVPDSETKAENGFLARREGRKALRNLQAQIRSDRFLEWLRSSLIFDQILYLGVSIRYGGVQRNRLGFHS